MIRLEYRSGNSEKFWQIQRIESQVQIEWGRIGTAGQSQSKDFPDQEAAEKFVQTNLRAKEKKGYNRVSEKLKPLQPLAITPQIPSKPSPEIETANNSSLCKLNWTPAQRAKKLEFKHLNYDYPIKLVPLKGPTSLELAWKKLAPEIDKQLQICALPESEEQQILMHALRKTCQSATPPLPSFEEAIWMLSLSRRRESIDFLWHRIGPEQTVQAWIRSRYLRAEIQYLENKGYQTVIVERNAPQAFQAQDLNQKNLALRAWLDNLSELDYQALVNQVQNLWECSQPEMQGALCQVFWQQQDWIHKACEDWLQMPAQPHQGLWEAGWLLWPLVQDEKLLNRLIEQWVAQKKAASQSLETFSQALEPWVFHFLDRTQEKALLSLKAWVLSGKKAGLRKAAAEAICLIDSPQALCVLVELLKNKDATQWAHAQLCQNPLAAIPVLIQFLAKKRAYPEAEQLLNRLIRACSAAEKKTLQAELGAVGADWLAASETPEASLVSDLPAFFSLPPWKKQNLLWPELKQIKLPTAPACMDWEAYQPDSDREIRPYIYDPPPLSDRRDSEILARFAGFDAIMLHHLDWLSDAAALKFWNQQDVNRWNPYEKEAWAVVQLSRRFGLLGLPGLLRYLERFPQGGYPALVCYDSPAAVPALLKGLILPAYRHLCQKWFLKHSENAFRGLIPLCLNPEFGLQVEALRVLNWLKTEANQDCFEQVLNQQSAEIRQSIEALTKIDPLQVLPTKMPSLPAFWTPEMLPRPQLKAGGTLPLASLAVIALSLKIALPCLPYAGLAEISRLCTPDSLEDFALSLFELWLSAGGNLKEEWAFWALAVWGREKALREWVPRLEKWPGERASSRALLGLEILFKMGPSAHAWSELHRLSLKTKFPSLLENARRWLKEMAATDPEGPEGLADRLAPQLGLYLSETGELKCEMNFAGQDYIIRQNPDQQLYLQDASGKTLKKPPAHASKAELKTWKDWVKDFQKQKALQTLRLEQAMVQGRRWHVDFFVHVFLKHPLLSSLASGLVWGIWQDSSELPVALFRLVQGKGCIDCDGQVVDFPEKSWIGLPHPLEMLSQLQVWQSNQMLQPFEQLNRRFFFRRPQELHQNEMSDWKGQKVASAKLLRLISHLGWETPKDSDGLLSKNFARGFMAEITVEYAIWALKDYPEVEVLQVIVHAPGSCTKHKIETLHPVVYSELRRDLQSLIA
jgi:predicted DNA-binding WGR domain protein